MREFAKPVPVLERAHFSEAERGAVDWPVVAVSVLTLGVVGSIVTVSAVDTVAQSKITDANDEFVDKFARSLALSPEKGEEGPGFLLGENARIEAYKNAFSQIDTPQKMHLIGEFLSSMEGAPSRGELEVALKNFSDFMGDYEEQSGLFYPGARGKAERIRKAADGLLADLVDLSQRLDRGEPARDRSDVVIASGLYMLQQAMYGK